jgi:hypothetical protein
MAAKVVKSLMRSANALVQLSVINRSNALRLLKDVIMAGVVQRILERPDFE